MLCEGVAPAVAPMGITPIPCINLITMAVPHRVPQFSVCRCSPSCKLGDHVPCAAVLQYSLVAAKPGYREMITLAILGYMCEIP